MTSSNFSVSCNSAFFSNFNQKKRKSHKNHKRSNFISLFGFKENSNHQPKYIRNFSITRLQMKPTETLMETTNRVYRLVLTGGKRKKNNFHLIRFSLTLGRCEFSFFHGEKSRGFVSHVIFRTTLSHSLSLSHSLFFCHFICNIVDNVCDNENIIFLLVFLVKLHVLFFHSYGT